MKIPPNAQTLSANFIKLLESMGTKFTDGDDNYYYLPHIFIYHNGDQVISAVHEKDVKTYPPMRKYLYAHSRHTEVAKLPAEHPAFKQEKEKVEKFDKHMFRQLAKAMIDKLSDDVFDRLFVPVKRVSNPESVHVNSVTPLSNQDKNDDYLAFINDEVHYSICLNVPTYIAHG